MQLQAAFLASAAVVVATGAARSADLPAVEAADQYVRICDAFGAGFFYIPASETCLKISGYVRAEAHYVDGDTDLLRPDEASEDFNNWTSRARANVAFETKTNSAFGLIRTYIEFQNEIGPDDYEKDYSAGSTELLYAVVEVSNDHGTFTAGRTDSFFDFFGSDDFGTRIDIDDNTTEQTLFAYTLNGPSGWRGTVSLEDPSSGGRRLDGADDYAGQEAPDLIGNVHLEKDWGSAQVMGMLRHIHDGDGAGNSDALGWAAGAGATVNLPGDFGLSAQAGYADGALAYITTDPGGVDDIGGPEASDTNQAWNIRAGLTAPLGRTISAWFDGSYTQAEDDNNDDDYNFWAFVVGAAWTPSDSVSMGPEVAYNNLHGDDAGEDGSLWGVMWRTESSF